MLMSYTGNTAHRWLELPHAKDLCRHKESSCRALIQECMGRWRMLIVGCVMPFTWEQLSVTAHVQLMQPAEDS